MLNELRPVQRAVLVDGGAKQAVKVRECRLSHLLVPGEHIHVDGDAVHAVLLPAIGTLPVEEASVGISILEIGDAGWSLVVALNIFKDPILNPLFWVSPFIPSNLNIHLTPKNSNPSQN